MHTHVNTPQPARLLLMLAAIGIAGCAAVGPNYTAPATDVPAGWSRLDPSAQPVMRADVPGDLSQWQQTLNDPLLPGLIDEALQASPDLRLAQARLREARARRTVAASGLYPGVTAFGSASRSRSSHGKAKALSILAHRIGRAAYCMLRKQRAFDLARFMRCVTEEGGEPVA